MIANRREFLKSAAAARIAAFAGFRPLPAADAEIEINPSQPGPLINPHIYGHFIEHLGGVIYDGIVQTMTTLNSRVWTSATQCALLIEI